MVMGGKEAESLPASGTKLPGSSPVSGPGWGSMIW